MGAHVPCSNCDGKGWVRIAPAESHQESVLVPCTICRQTGRVWDEYAEPPGCCFLTTACVVTRGLPDDCHELRTLRKFRDEYVVRTPGGIALVQRYYRIAPAIIARIDACSLPEQEYRALWSDLVRPCVSLLEHGRKTTALDRYAKVVTDLSSSHVREISL